MSKKNGLNNLHQNNNKRKKEDDLKNINKKLKIDEDYYSQYDFLMEKYGQDVYDKIMFIVENDIGKDNVKKLFCYELKIALKHELSEVIEKIFKHLNQFSLSLMDLEKYDNIILINFNMRRKFRKLLCRKYIIKRPIYHNEYSESLNCDLLEKDSVKVKPKFLQTHFTWLINILQLY